MWGSDGRQCNGDESGCTDRSTQPHRQAGQSRPNDLRHANTAFSPMTSPGLQGRGTRTEGP